jgi:hypothetical protein
MLKSQGGGGGGVGNVEKEMIREEIIRKHGNRKRKEGTGRKRGKTKLMESSFANWQKFLPENTKVVP